MGSKTQPRPDTRMSRGERGGSWGMSGQDGEGSEGSGVLPWLLLRLRLPGASGRCWGAGLPRLQDSEAVSPSMLEALAPFVRCLEDALV